MKNSQNDSKEKNFPRSPETFPKPRTIPEGWDFAEANNPVSNSSEKGDSKLNAAAENGIPQVERSPEGFPITNTFPNGWDLAQIYQSPER